jgi:hypothetical protein
MQLLYKRSSHAGRGTSRGRDKTVDSSWKTRQGVAKEARQAQYTTWLTWRQEGKLPETYARTVILSVGSVRNAVPAVALEE